MINAERLDSEALGKLWVTAFTQPPTVKAMRLDVPVVLAMASEIMEHRSHHSQRDCAWAVRQMIAGKTVRLMAEPETWYKLVYHDNIKFPSVSWSINGKKYVHGEEITGFHVVSEPWEIVE